MIVHIIGQTMYTTDLYNFINDNFEHDDQIFITGKAKDPNVQSPIGLNRTLSDVKIIPPKNLICYMKFLNKADGVVIHGIFSAKHLAVISMRKKWLKKTCWVIWGGDIYQHNKEHRSLKDRAAEKIKLKYASEFGFIAPLVEKDIPLAQKWYGIKGEIYLVSYPVPLQRKGVLDKILKKGRGKTIYDGKPVKVMLGNSATETNCHIEALDALSKYKNENLLLYIPLSYGFHGYKDYANKIIAYAEKLFGKEKVRPILEKMDGEEYTNLLSDIDVAVFYNNRQQAMGNIAILIAAGAKIYIRDDTSMWEHYISKGYELENAFRIPEMKFEEFCTYENSRKSDNMALIKKYLDIQILKQKWEKLFEAMKGKKYYDE